MTEDIWKCGSCGYTSESNTENGYNVIGFTLGPILVNVCPKCRSISMDKEFYEDLMLQKKSKIIQPKERNVELGLSRR